jgi:hypothetical protein
LNSVKVTLVAKKAHKKDVNLWLEAQEGVSSLSTVECLVYYNAVFYTPKNIYDLYLSLKAASFIQYASLDIGLVSYTLGQAPKGVQPKPNSENIDNLFMGIKTSLDKLERADFPRDYVMDRVFQSLDGRY